MDQYILLRHQFKVFLSKRYLSRQSPNKVCPNRVTHNKAIHSKAIHSKVCLNRAIRKAIPNKAIPNRAIPNRECRNNLSTPTRKAIIPSRDISKATKVSKCPRKHSSKAVTRSEAVCSEMSAPAFWAESEAVCLAEVCSARPSAARSAVC